jgi:hypothetical protein
LPVAASGRSAILLAVLTTSQKGAAAYCGDTDQCYFFGFDPNAQNEMRLRVGPTRNNQAKGLRWARDYEFGAKLIPLLGP